MAAGGPPGHDADEGSGRREPEALDLDRVQARAAGWAPQDGHLLVLGAPGTGKSLVARRLAVRRALEGERAPASVADGGVLMLVAQRRRADQLQLDLDRELAGTRAHVAARTASGLAFAILGQYLTGILEEPAPTLLTGADVDAILGDLLAGHASGAGAQPSWPAAVREETLLLPAFRHELRDLLTRAAEEGISAEQLGMLGERHGRQVWQAAATVMEEYENVLALGTIDGRGRRYDHARVLSAATRALEHWGAGPHARSRPRFSLVVVDDHQDSTAAVTRLLRVLAADGAQIALTGDPDVAVEQFRGGRAHLVGEAAAPLDAAHPTGFGAHVLRLPVAYRGGRELTAAVRDLSAHVRPTTTGAAHRTARPVAPVTAEPGGVAGAAGPRDLDAASGGSAGGNGGQNVAADARARVGRSGVQLAVLPSSPGEGAYLARRLREEHVLAGVPWSRMAVLVRSSADVTRVRAALRTAEVPTDTGAPSQALRTEPAVRPLLRAVSLALDAARGVPLHGAQVRELTQSVIGGLTAVQVRLLLRAMRARAEEGADADELLVEAMWQLAAPDARPEFGGVLGSAQAGLARVGRAVAAGRDALTARGRPAAGVPASRVLWEVWERTGLARLWQREALAGGAGAERAHEDLDAVLALFAAAERYDERTPGGGIGGFLAVVERQDLPQDTLGRRGRRTRTVQVLTAAAAAGQSWDVVAVAGVQEDAWPNLRIRDTLLGTGDLVDLLADRETIGLRTPREKRREVLDDELRLFLAALSRAERLAIVTAVGSQDQRPSMFFEALAGDTLVEDLAVRVPDPLTLRGLTGALRREAEEAAAAERAQDDPSVRLLAHLARRGVAWADPAAWHGVLAPSTTAPLVPADQRVRVSPSAVSGVQDCALRWLLTTHGGQQDMGRAAAEGTVLHAIAEKHPHGTPEQMREELTRLLPGLGHDETTWAGRRRAERLRRAVDRLAGYVQAHDLRDANEEHVRVEVALGGVEVGRRAVISGRSDRLEAVTDVAAGEPVDGWRVVDFKTGASVLTKNEVQVDPQLATYQVALEEGGLGTALGAKLVYLGVDGPQGTKEVRERRETLGHLPGPAEREQDRLARRAELGRGPAPGSPGATPGAQADPEGRLTFEGAVAMIDAAAQVMGGDRFEPTVNETCRTCPVTSVCPVGAFSQGNDS